MVFLYHVVGRDAGQCIATPLVWRTPRAGIPTQQPPFGGCNTVAAQRRILTVFPIYFLRLPAASRVFSRAQTGTQVRPLSNHNYPRSASPFFVRLPQKKPCRFRQGLVNSYAMSQELLATACHAIASATAAAGSK